MSEHKGVTQHPRQRCYFCGSDGPIQTHHVVPRRYDGSDDEENLVDLCCNCHQRLEKLYDKRFYEEISVARTANPQVDYDVDAVKEWVAEECNPVEKRQELVYCVAEGRNIDNPHYQEAELIISDMIERGWLAESTRGMTTTYEVSNQGEVKRTSRTEKEASDNLKSLISRIEGQHTAGAPEEIVYECAVEELEINKKEAKELLKKLRVKGEVYEPKQDHLRTT